MTEMTWAGVWPGRPERRAGIDSGVLMIAFVAAAAASSWFVVANVSGAVGQFGGRVAFLGAARPYATSAPSVVAWGMLLTGALVLVPYARRSEVAPVVGFGLRALVVGAAAQVLGALLSLWVSGLTTQFNALLVHAAEIDNLLRASDALTCVSLLAFASGAVAARATIATRDIEPTTRRRWRQALSFLAVALVVGAMAQGYEVVGSLLFSTPPVQLTIVMVDVLTSLLWIGIAAGLVLVGRALQLDAKLRRLVTASAVGVYGTALLALAAACQFAYLEVIDARTSTRWLLVLSRVATASECMAWLVLTTGFVLAAIAMRAALPPRATMRHR